MNIIRKLLIPIAVLCMGTTVSCSEKEQKPSGSGWQDWVDSDKEPPVEPVELEGAYDYTTLAPEIYQPSFNSNLYSPIAMQYATQLPASSWKNAKARLVAFMDGFDHEMTRAEYVNHTNRYGSNTKLPQQEATGRFYIKKINGRWWMVDPYGYLHYHRGVASLRQGSSSRNAEAFNTKFGGDVNKWMEWTQEELAKVGMHASGAFSDYASIKNYNMTHTDSPITLAPSFSFLSQFKSRYNLKYCNGNSNTAAALVLNEKEWAEFCENYIRNDMAQYLNDPNVVGFFSDNEINFTSNGSPKFILDRILNSNNADDIAYRTAKEFMTSKGATEVTAELNEEFAGMLAEKYYRGVKEALLKVDKGMLYLGSRLHGTPKYMKSIIEAAGRWCDIISINYYSRWDVELTEAVKEWAEWADAPFMVTEFYTKAEESDLNNSSGAGFGVKTHRDKACAYQHFTLGLLEAKNCVGWHWFKYQDDDGSDNDGKPANKGLIDNYYEMFPWMGQYVKDVNYNAYRLIEYFDK